MKLRFDATLDDFIDVAVRSSPLTNEWYVYFALYTVGTALVNGIIAQFLWSNPYITGIGAAGGAIYIVLANYKIRERRARRLYQDTYRITKPVAVKVEITEGGLSFKQFGITTIYDWDAVRIAEQTDDAIYFRIPCTHILAVRNRAFASDAQKEEFLEMVNHY